MSFRRFYASVCDNTQSRCLSFLLAMPSRVYIFFPPRDHKLPPTLHDRLNPHISASNAVTFQSLAMSNARISLCTQSVHSFSIPPRLFLPSRFPNTIHFGNRQPLIQMKAPARKINVFSCASSSQCSHTGLSRGHDCTRSFDGLVSCAVPR